MKHLCLLLIIAFAMPAHAKLLFEGFYRIEKGNKHVGYMIQRDQIDDKTKERSISYLGVRQTDTLSYESVRAVAKEAAGMPFEPVRYTHMLSARGKGPPMMEEGIFNGKELNVTVSDVSEAARNDKTKKISQPKKIVAKFKAEQKPDYFMSSFIPASIVAQGPESLRPGTEFTYTAMAEETRIFAPGEFKILRVINTADGKRVIHGLNRFPSNTIEYFMYSDGQILGYRSGDTVVYLIKKREEAMGEIPFLKEQALKTFGDLPFGLENPVSKAQGKADAKATIFAASKPTDAELKFKPGAAAKKLGRAKVSK